MTPYNIFKFSRIDVLNHSPKSVFKQIIIKPTDLLFTSKLKIIKVFIKIFFCLLKCRLNLIGEIFLSVNKLKIVELI